MSFRRLPLDRVFEPRLFTAERDLNSDFWRIRLRCPVTGDIEGVRLSDWAAAQMMPDPGAVFIAWANQLSNWNDRRRIEGVSREERYELARRERGPLLNRLLADAETRAQSAERRQTAVEIFTRNFEITTFNQRPQQVRLGDLFQDTRGTAEAILRSRDLLVANLNPDQLQDFEKTGCFNVAVCNNIYRIRTGTVFNIIQLGTGERFCGGCPHLPVYDSMLAQKLYLETMPEVFFANANSDRSLVRPPLIAEQPNVTVMARLLGGDTFI